MRSEGQAPDPWRHVFETHVEFDLVFLDGDRWHCRLLQWSATDLLVETDRGTYLVPRHAIKYLAVDERREELLEEIAAEVPTLQEFLDEPGASGAQPSAT